jgi:hypothetical protein
MNMEANKCAGFFMPIFGEKRNQKFADEVFHGT